MQPVGLGSGDINGDGGIDIAAPSAAGPVDVFINNGAGSFLSRSTFTGLGTVSGTAVLVADLDGDGKADVAVPQANGVGILFSSVHSAGMANLIPTLAGTPAVAVAGDALRTREVVTLTNNGTAAPTGPVTIKLFLSADQSLDSGDTPVITVKRNLPLGRGGVRAVPINLRRFPSVVSNSYFMLRR